MKPSLAIAMASKKAAHKSSGGMCYAQGGEVNFPKKEKPKSYHERMVEAAMKPMHMSDGGMIEAIRAKRMDVGNEIMPIQHDTIHDDFLSDEMDNVEEPPYSPHMPDDEYREADGMHPRKDRLARIMETIRMRNLAG